jgi:hypothetical protein
MKLQSFSYFVGKQPEIHFCILCFFKTRKNHIKPEHQLFFGTRRKKLAIFFKKFKFSLIYFQIGERPPFCYIFNKESSLNIPVTSEDRFLFWEVVYEIFMDSLLFWRRVLTLFSVFFLGFLLSKFLFFFDKFFEILEMNFFEHQKKFRGKKCIFIKTFLIKK